jgi:DNA repair photolyase
MKEGMTRNESPFRKGRGAQAHPPNPYHSTYKEYWDQEDLFPEKTQYVEVEAKSIVNRVKSPDLQIFYSLNPYQGCEHGCIYCYARNSHTYWDYDMGLDFETRILVKTNAPELLEKFFQQKSWEPWPILLSGNTDPYQPAEVKYQLTRRLLQVFLKYKNPVEIITKNALILRDLHLLTSLSYHGLVRVRISLTTANEELRRKMEPRTATFKRRLETIRVLSQAGIPVIAMIAPMIPNLNMDELPFLMRSAAEAGALDAHYTLVRLPKQLFPLFQDWLKKAFPEKYEKTIRLLLEARNGKPGDARWFYRQRGEGKLADLYSQTFHVLRKKYFHGRTVPPFNLTAFTRPTPPEPQLSLFPDEKDL